MSLMDQIYVETIHYKAKEKFITTECEVSPEHFRSLLRRLDQILENEKIIQVLSSTSIPAAQLFVEPKACRTKFIQYIEEAIDSEIIHAQTVRKYENVQFEDYTEFRPTIGEVYCLANKPDRTTDPSEVIYGFEMVQVIPKCQGDKYQVDYVHYPNKQRKEVSVRRLHKYTDHLREVNKQKMAQEDEMRKETENLSKAKQAKIMELVMNLEEEDSKVEFQEDKKATEEEVKETNERWQHVSTRSEEERSREMEKCSEWMRVMYAELKKRRERSREAFFRHVKRLAEESKAYKLSLVLKEMNDKWSEIKEKMDKMNVVYV